MARITDDKTGLYFDALPNEDIGVYWSYQSNKYPSEKFIIWEIEDYNNSNKVKHKCVIYLNVYIDDHDIVINILRDWFNKLEYVYGTEHRVEEVSTFFWAHLNETELDDFEKVLIDLKSRGEI